ncbi:hypothetical protein AAFF_G00123440 [Aldrovandia affinis]|uniref:HAUS augmin-like complex subunit 7 n=1 Tax=Aldrovandia affinis TaxID=143900 RepID=A0AAD7RRL3_9TELE|nr:hypothetical protein AAFF_G00123440 [Aldrovandia affinis]
MAGTLKENQLSEHIYSKMQGLGCPLVEGLFLRSAESMKDLLCTPSLHRTDILKWMCVSCCPSLMEKFATIGSAQSNAVVQEIVRFGHDIMLCKHDDQDLIKGLAPPLIELFAVLNAEEAMVRREEFLGELLSHPQLAAILTPTCSPWSADLRELLHRKAPASKTGPNRPAEDSAVEVSALLRSTESVLEDLRKECTFLQSDGVSPSPRLSPCALRLAISDLSQLMLAFSQSFNAEFKGYCHRQPPALSSNAHRFRTVHQLLLACNQELRALQQLSEASGAVTAIAERMRTDRRYWGDGQKHTLPAKLEMLKKKYTEFLSLHPG